MGWAPGEQERELNWYISRSKRMANRAWLELQMLPVDPMAPIRLYDDFEPLIDFTNQMKQPEEEEFEDSKVVKNHNIW